MNAEDVDRAYDLATASSDADLRQWERGVPLADMECSHGHLPGGPCECFAIFDERSDVAELLADLAPNTVECKTEGCTAEAPRLGKYAGKCQIHRPAAAAAKAKPKRRREAEVVLVQAGSELVEAARRVDEARAIYDDALAKLRDLVKDDR